MNFIPKIVFGTQTIQFEHPPEGDYLNWDETANQKTSRSFNGKIQTTWGYNEVIIKPLFRFIPQYIKNQVQDFFDNWASLGKSFAYYPSFDDSEFYTVVLAKKQFSPDILIPANIPGDFSWMFSLELELVNIPLPAGSGAGDVSRPEFEALEARVTNLENALQNLLKEI